MSDELLVELVDDLQIEEKCFAVEALWVARAASRYAHALVGKPSPCSHLFCSGGINMSFKAVHEFVDSWLRTLWLDIRNERLQPFFPGFQATSSASSSAAALSLALSIGIDVRHVASGFPVI